MKMKSIVLTVCLVSILSSTMLGQSNRPSGKPNIIFILTDDLGYGDIGVFFQQQRAKANNRSEPSFFTPQLDKLAQNGAMLTQHYCAAPVCAPSRASLLLGVSQGHANVRDNQFDKALEDNYTLGNVLQQAGYATAAIGKWGLPGNLKKLEWPAQPLKRGFDFYYGYMRHGDGHEHYPKEGIYNHPKEVWDNRTEVSKDLDKCYTADLWTAVAKKWITDHKNSKNREQPFFMYLAYDTPHAVLELPTQPYPVGGGLKGGLQWTGEKGHMINTASGTPDSWVHPDYANATYDDDSNASTPEVPWPETYKRYATAIRRIDDAVGDMMQLLKDLSIDNNTLVVFSSDNGPSIESYLPKEYVPNRPDFFNSFGPFDGIKRDCWEGGVRMPTLALWPGHISAGKIITMPSISYDWMPTFTEAAGLPAPVRTDGVSLLPALTGKPGQKPGRVYIEYYFKGRTPNFNEFDPQHRNRQRNQMQMIRLGDTLGVRYDIQSAEDDFEIYDIVKDPQQKNNLAHNSGMVALQARMKEKVLQQRRPDSDAVRPYDDALVPALANRATKPGIIWTVYPGGFPWVPDVTGLKSLLKGVAEDPGLATVKKTKNTTILIEGYLRVPQDGTYTFYLRAGAKTFLRIHDAAVVDGDYKNVPGRQLKGEINLKAGLHPFRLYYASKENKRPKIELKWEGPGIKQQVIPDLNYCN